MSTPAGDAASRAAALAAETAARHAYGRLLAWLAWQWRDIAAAEDALGEAFATALTRWPRDGVPDSPEGWLLATARRVLLGAARRQRLAEDPALTVLWPDERTAAPAPPALPDDRLRLLFVCAHPTIDPSVRPALMLQTVLGLDAARVASAFLVSPAAMGKRLVRAKAKIKASGIRFEEPESSERAPRLHAVLEAIYGAYTLDGAAPAVPEAGGAAGELAAEALYLAQLVAAQDPPDPEALGLLALLLCCEARRPARTGPAGEFVPLDRQDSSRWDGARLQRADALLARAAARGAPGPFQLEAAIQAAHCARVQGGPVPWPEILRLYERLLELAPTVGAAVGHAVALAEASGDTTAALQRLHALQRADPQALASYQPWWVACGHLQAVTGANAAARDSYRRALGLTTDPALRAFLQQRLQALAG